MRLDHFTRVLAILYLFNLLILYDNATIYIFGLFFISLLYCLFILKNLIFFEEV